MIIINYLAEIFPSVFSLEADVKKQQDALNKFNSGLNGLVLDELLLSSIRRTKAFHTVLMMNNLILAWQLKIVLSVLVL